MNNFPSIFNDVIGPVMRGPSSSHTAASWRVAMMAVQMLRGKLKEALVEFDREGAWVTNYEEQGTVLGMDGGLLQINMADDLMKQTKEIAAERGIKIVYKISSFENTHANSMQLTLRSEQGDYVKVLAASLGGGSFEIQKIDTCKVRIKGDYHVLLIWSDKDIGNELKEVKPVEANFINVGPNSVNLSFFESSEPFNETLIEHIKHFHGHSEYDRTGLRPHS